MQVNEFYKTLVERYTSGKASNEELEVFFDLLEDGKLEPYLNESLAKQSGIYVSEDDVVPVVQMQLHPRRYLWAKWAAAAAILAAAGLIAFNILNPSKPEKEKIAASQAPKIPASDVAPGGNKAVLRLADGSTIVLDSAVTGQLAKEGDAVITKTSDGSIVYKNAHASNDNQAIAYNTLTTPRGGQFQIDLPDSTRIWLNAATTLRYPARFTGKERVVELDGEAYFEVAKNAKMPFRVKMNRGVTVEVLGTHFNINSYETEPLKATLLEGAIKIRSTDHSELLSPGQEALVKEAGSITVNDDADIEQAIAWKNGLFQFNRADIHTIMKQLERWYDVQVVFAGSIPQKEFVGKVSRNTNLSEVLEILELSKIHFKIEGDKLTVMP